MRMATTIQTQCCIVGGGPAGMMLGVLLARAGVEAVVLEKHADFLRDFRGDTVHPSTLEVMYELGWLDDFLQRPHQELRELSGIVGDERVTIADFTHLPVHCPFIALMPQWEFLDFVAGRGRTFPTFSLRMQTEVVDLLREGEGEHGRVAGVVAKTQEGTIEIRADLTVGADGRSSIVRERAGLVVDAAGVPIDVLWMRLPRRPDDPHNALGNIRNGFVFVTINRGDYWQCAFVIQKGGYDDLKRAGLDAFRQAIVSIVPIFADRVGELRDWDDVKLLTVRIDRLREWYRPGLLCIGDAAHAMSPVGGVGINLAIQDAVAAANRLAGPLRRRETTVDDLRAVQDRRAWPTKWVQRGQQFIQDRFLSRALGQANPTAPPLPVRLMRDHAFLRRIPARLVGMGLRPEHVHTPVEVNQLPPGR
jgi:2-polyprenyl-6-methoxyphenol hydroxylase-like FAD-dependent oxidoreductase